VKDGDAAHPVASDWRPTLREIVAALSRGDFALAGITSVAPVDPTTQDQIKRYLAAYGETLDELSEETWRTSVAQWMETHWEVLVDLWTKEAGDSDLVLHARVFEEGPGDYRVVIDSVHVP
jgi:hypothetical protein